MMLLTNSIDTTAFLCVLFFLRCPLKLYVLLETCFNTRKIKLATSNVLINRDYILLKLNLIPLELREIYESYI